MDILDSKSDIGGPLYKRMVHYVTNCRNDPNSPILKIQKKSIKKNFFFHQNLLITNFMSD